jgi:hypothetical protein
MKRAGRLCGPTPPTWGTSRRLALPKRIDTWPLRSLQQRLMKRGGRLVKHARYYWLLLASKLKNSAPVAGN